jgi:hypothetical protein
VIPSFDETPEVSFKPVFVADSTSQRKSQSCESSQVLTVNVNTDHLLLHDAGVDLAHVATTVGLLHLTDVQLPRAVIVVCHADP